MTESAWVLGGGGLLGAALRRALHEQGAELFSPSLALSWDDPAAFTAEIETHVRLFAQRVRRSERWTISWAAGRGTMGSTPEQMNRDTDLLASLLRVLEQTPELRSTPGSLFFASTAGGIYGGSKDEPITERSSPSATLPYGLEKLKQEHVVIEWSKSVTSASVLIGRISTLYGPGQTQTKAQGLISHVARCLLRQEPIHIFVPLDTIRDYLYAEDAARDIALCLEAPDRLPGVTIKIVASEQPTTVAQIIGTFRQIARRMPRIITSTHPLGRHYMRAVRFRSVVPPRAKATNRTSLLVGISAVMSHEKLALAAAGRPPARGALRSLTG